MLINIPYDSAVLDVDFPDGTIILEPISPIIPDISVVREKIIAGFRKYDRQFAGKTITIVVNDATRRLPTSRILDILMEIVPPSAMEIIVATGTHRSPTDSELDIILGNARNAFEGRIFVHDCRDDDSLVHLGYTSRGTPVDVNRKLVDSECLISVNSVEPHFFAGYTGGRKSLVPGLAGFSTTVLNHSHAKLEGAKSLNLHSNPVHQDLEEAVSFLRHIPHYSIQLVTSRSGEIVDVFCGELDDSFERAVPFARDIYSVKIGTKYDIVLAVGEYPLDINLYQLQKAQEHGAEAVRDNGILIVVGACNEGSGSDYFINLANDYPDPQSALSDKALNDNRYGIHKLVKTARRLRQIKVWYVTKLDDKIIRKVYYEPVKSVNAALSAALEILGADASVAVLKDACFIVPVL